MALCGAKTRKGTPCKREAMPNGRCNLHGGKSTGPKDREKAAKSQEGNQNRVKWGFFAKHVDPEQLAIMQEIDAYDPVDIIWQNILISYSAIIRAQRIMFVVDQDDIVQNVKRVKDSESLHEEEVEFQYPWDRHANFMQAQARAMSELRALMKEFVAMADDGDARKLKLESMQKEIELRQIQIEEAKSGSLPVDGLKLIADYGDSDE